MGRELPPGCSSTSFPINMAQGSLGPPPRCYANEFSSTGQKKKSREEEEMLKVDGSHNKKKRKGSSGKHKDTPDYQQSLN
ncbi:hypothetical protein MHYP_G00156730 [Metynnis hypsauchen]